MQTKTIVRVIGAAALSAGLLTTGCKKETSDEPSASKTVEQAQIESEEALETAKEAQEKARDEQEDVRSAQENLIEKQEELTEAQQKEQQERMEAESAQAQAQAQSQQALQTTQSAQARAASAQQEARRSTQLRAQPRDTDMDIDKPVTTPSATPDPWANAKPDTEVQKQPATPTETPAQPQANTSAGDEPMQSDIGVVRSASDSELVIVRDNGSVLRLKLDKWAATMPAEGQRVKVEYTYDGMQPVAVNIEEQ